MVMKDMTELIKEYGCITPEIAADNGISKYKFYKYVRENNMEQVEHGIYIFRDEWVDELYVLHKRCPNAVFSHNEALYFYGLTDREPLVHTLTMYSGYNSHRLTADGRCKVYTVKKELLDVGKVFVKDNCGNEIPMYDIDRTICDVIRSRSTIDIQEFIPALKAYARRNDNDLNKLWEYSKLFRIQTVVRKYMEVLL